MDAGQAIDYALGGIACCISLVAVQAGHYGFGLAAFALAALCLYAAIEGLD